MLRTIIYVHAYNIKDFPTTYRNDSVLCQSECANLHNTFFKYSFNLFICYFVLFFLDKKVNTVKSNDYTYPKGRALFQMYNVVPKTKRENSTCQGSIGEHSIFTVSKNLVLHKQLIY